MIINASELHTGQIFRFPGEVDLYVVKDLTYLGSCNYSIKYHLESIPNYCSRTLFSDSDQFFVDIPPYTNQQLTLF